MEAERSLNQQRLQVVLQTLKQSGAERVLDLGCGEGRLLELLAAEGQFVDITGMDVSTQALTRARRRLERLPRGERVEVFQGSLAYRDGRLTDYDAAALVEVIEHLDPPCLQACERAVFEFARPGSVVVTTPNADYNAHWQSLPHGGNAWVSTTVIRRVLRRSGRRTRGWARRRRWRFLRGRAPMVEQEITVAVPVLSLVVLIGVSSSGKSTFARDHFAPTEVLSSDFFRAMVSDDENSLEATEDAFSALHFVAARRLARGHLTVVDATNVQPSARKGLIDLAKRYHAQTVAIVLDVPEALCKERNAARADRNIGDHVIPQQHKQLRRSLKRLKAEGFRRTFVLRSAEEAARVSVVREKLWTDWREEVGPFDIIGDVHGCFAELERLLTELGYDIAGEKVQPPPGCKAVFVGDLVDRGPDVPRVLALRSFALYGETTGEQDEFGLPVRGNWAAEYRGAARVVYGHTPVARAEWLNNTINIDTGCVFGGALTALRYPEQAQVSGPAEAQYADPVLDLADVAGGGRVETRLTGRVTIREERSAAALEVMSRFAVDPKWLVYLPPTMAPPRTSARPDVLEHPDEVLAYYRRSGVKELLCEEKHMGSRAVLVVCRDAAAARRRFGVEDGLAGSCAAGF